MLEEKNENEAGKVTMSKKQKIIISILAVVFLIVLVGAFWDLYGKNISYNCSQPSSAVSNNSQAVVPTSETVVTSNNQAISQTGQKGNKQGSKGNATATITGATASSANSAVYESCINKTKDNPECKNCCDCLSGSDSATITSCRNTCATHDFATNTTFITVNAPSVLGEKGDYSTCTNEVSSGECKTCCESSMGLKCGDYRFCRTACNTKFGTTSGPQQ